MNDQLELLKCFNCNKCSTDHDENCLMCEAAAEELTRMMSNMIKLRGVRLYDYLIKYYAVTQSDCESLCKIEMLHDWRNKFKHAKSFNVWRDTDDVSKRLKERYNESYN